MKIKNIENALAKLCNRKYVLLTGNATTSLYLSIKSLKLPSKSEIMIPNSSCPHVPLSIYLAGHSPVFIDIDKKNFGLNLKEVKKNFSKKIKAIIAVHAYGKICHIQRLVNFCKKHKIFLIEDAALSLGLKIKNKASGSFGLASVISFGKGKVIDIGGGGALLTDDRMLYLRSKSLISRLSSKKKINDKMITQINDVHTKIYNNLFVKNKINLIKKKYRTEAIKKSSYFLYKFESKLLKKLDLSKKNLNKILRTRYKNINYISKKLHLIKKNFFNVPIQKKNEAPWRMNIFFYKEKNRNFVLKEMLKKKLKVSSWHPSLDIFFKDRTKSNTYPTSDKLSRSILNIWINHEINQSYLNDVCKNILEIKKTISLNKL